MRLWVDTLHPEKNVFTMSGDKVLQNVLHMLHRDRFTFEEA